MKRVIICAFALLICWPALSHAQSDDPDQPKSQYRDIEDGQFLRVLSYMLTPLGMALEWGVTRPLHYAATQTPAAPLLRGDSEASFFDQNNNASLVPPGTFDPSPINLSNNYDSGDEPELSSSRSVVPMESASNPLSTESIPPSKPLIQGGQPALH